MDLRKLKTILDLFESSNIAELEITEENERLRLVKHPSGTSPVGTQPTQVIMTPPASTPASDVAPTPAGTAAATETTTPPVDDGLVKLESPMVGTFYAKPGEGEAEFVKVGDHVNEGDTVCIIEAMKLFNNVAAPVTGRVTQIHVANEQAVGYGELLMTFKADE